MVYKSISSIDHENSHSFEKSSETRQKSSGTRRGNNENSGKGNTHQKEYPRNEIFILDSYCF